MKRFLSSVFGALAVLAACAPAPVHAATINAASCSLANVQTAVTASVDGDTVQMPAGSCTWNATLTVTKGIRIEGAGATLNSGFVTGGVASPTILAGGRFTIDAPAGKTVVIGGFNLTGTAGFNFVTASKSWRVHHVNMTQVTGFTQNRHFWIAGTSSDYTQGLIDHVEVYDPNGIQIHPRESMWGGNNSYDRPLGLGGPDAVYIEDSYFSQPANSYDVSSPITDCDGGGRIVFRHNTIRSNYFEMHDAVVPGSRSCRKWEVYQNTWITTSSDISQTNQFAQIATRGGTGVMFGNRMLASTIADADITFANYRTYQGNNGDPWNDLIQNSGNAKACLAGSTPPVSCTSDAQCGNQVGACVKKDGSGGTGLPTNYPGRDQMGTDGAGLQHNRPALYWDNKFTGGTGSNIAAGNIPISAQGNSLATYLVQGRDYCVSTSTMPTACNGVPTTYVPYTYPHPLQAGAVAPKPPTNVTAP